MSFKKETEKIVLLQVKGLIHIVNFRTKKNCTSWEGHHWILPLGTNYYVAIKERIESLYFPDGKQIGMFCT